MDASSVRKWSWAKHHLHTLESEVASFQREQPYRVIAKSNDDHTRYEFSLEFHDRPFGRWALMAGDVLSNLRQALDHVVYEIAVQEAQGRVPEGAKNLMFPLTSSNEEFLKARGRLKTLSPAVQAEIERLQPYNHHGGIDNSSIWHLADAHNRDKHRSLRVAVAGIEATEVLLEGLVPGSRATFQTESLAPEDGAPFMSALLERSTPGLKMTVRRKAVQMFLLRSAPPEKGREGTLLLPFLNNCVVDVGMFIRLLGGRFAGYQ